MKNEILEEVWKAKEEVSRRHNGDVKELAEDLRQREKQTKKQVVDMSHKEKDVA
jgi:hypothetical protein